MDGPGDQSRLGDHGVGTGADGADDAADGAAEAAEDEGRAAAEAAPGEPEDAPPGAFAVTKVDYTVDRDGDGPHEPTVHVFGRTPDGALRRLDVEGFRPYFYAPEDQVDERDHDAITGVEPGYTSIDGRELARVYARIPADVGKIRDDYDHHEADILFPNRFRIDHDVTAGIAVDDEALPDAWTDGDAGGPDGSSALAGGGEGDDVDADDAAPDGDAVVADEGGAPAATVGPDDVAPADVAAPARTMIVDIEVDDRRGFPEDGEEPIVCLTAWDSFEEAYHVFAFDVPQSAEGDDFTLHRFDEETNMLDAFVAYLDDRDPDVLTGWNFDDFDAPYLIDRMEQLGMDSGRLSRVGEVWHDGWGGPTIKGRSTFDLLYGYQRMRFTELDSYRLDAIAEEELGESKVTYTGKIGDLWEDEPERLLEYNKVDVELCVEIDEKVGIVDFFRELSRFVGCSLEDSTTPSDVVDVYVLRKAHGRFVLPSKGGGGGDDYEGGEVFEPITGVRENVMVLDLASLYPMSMVTVNASPETKVGGDYEGATYDVETPEGTVRFRKDREGLTKSIVTELLEERQKKKDARDRHEMNSDAYEKYDNQQNAIKVVMNCFSDDTEVVTEHGVTNITDVEVGDRVYSIDPETGAVELQPVIETQRYAYDDGEMVDIDTRYVDFSVTPNHRMLVEKDGETRFVEAGDLNEYTQYQIPNGDPIPGETPQTFDLLEDAAVDPSYAYVSSEDHGRSFLQDLPAAEELEYESNRRSYKTSPATLRDHPAIVEAADEVLLQQDAKHGSVPHAHDMEDWLRFVGWFVSEGSVYEIQPKEYEDATRGRSKKIQFGQLDDGNRDRIVALLERMGLSPSREARQISVSNAVLADWLVEHCGSGSAEKRLPAFVFDLDWRLLEVLFETLIDGDGDRHSGTRYSTKSDRLKDDVVRLAAHLGYKPLVNRDSGVWRIRFSRNEGAFRMHRNGGSSETDGDVHCVTVADNHTVLAGRNGTFQWVGQSYYGVAGYSRFRLYDREMGRAVTACGRQVIEHTRDAVEEMGYDVIYGDTDSTLVEIGPGPGVDEIVEIGLDLEERVNASYDDFALEEFNAEEHRWEIEFEKLYRRFFQAGRKKRYAGKLVWKEGKEIDDVDITGFEYKRSDVAPITKEVQKAVIERIVEGEPVEDVAAYLRDVVEEFKQGELDLDEVAIPGGIGQKLDEYDTDTAHVKGARYANRHFGTNFTSGSKPKRVYVERVTDEGYPPTDVICFEYPEQVPEGFDVDWDKMLEKTLQSPIERILEALGWSWSEVVSGQRQQGLGSFG